jgi:hypothetical protein
MWEQFIFGGRFGVVRWLTQPFGKFFHQLKFSEFSQNGEMSAKFRVLAKSLTDIFVSSLEVSVARFVLHL